MTTRKEITSSLAVILFGAVFLAYTTRYPLDSWDSPGPAVFPLILGVALVLLAGGQLIGALRKRARSHRDERHHHGRQPFASLLHNSGDGKALRMVLLFVAYLLLMPWLGFFVTSFVFGMLTSRLTEAIAWWKTVLLTCGLTLFCYLLFEIWLKLPFPRGILI